MIKKKVVQELADKFGVQRVKENHLLSPYTSIKVGGAADIFLTCTSNKEFSTAVSIALSYALPITILGSGTCTIISDRGIPGLVIKNEAGRIRIAGVSGSIRKNKAATQLVVFEAESGCLLNQMVRYSLDEGLAGLESFLGQPGTVGGAFITNIYDTERKVFFRDLVINATIITPNNEVCTLARTQFNFNSHNFSRLIKKNFVLSLRLLLKKSSKEEIWRMANGTLARRHTLQPIGMITSGNVFDHISQSDALRIHTPERSTAVEYVLKSIGLKGLRIGSAMYSDTYMNFIMNVDSASSYDILNLVSEAKKRARQNSDIILRERIVFLGEHSWKK